MNWEDRTTVKKGNIGETIVSNYFRKRNYIPYIPDMEGPHPFDRIMARGDKKEIFIAEVKTKARRSFFPDTGIDIKHYNQYKFIEMKYNIDIFIYFVDEYKKEIYGNILRILDKPRKYKYKYQMDKNGRIFNKEIEYPIKSKGIIYFPLKIMKIISKIDDETIKKLKKYNNRSYGYNFPIYEELIEVKKDNFQKTIFDFNDNK